MCQFVRFVWSRPFFGFESYSRVLQTALPVHRVLPRARTYRGIVAGVKSAFFSMIRTPRIDQLFLVGFIIKVVHQAYGHPEKFFLVHTRPKHGLSWISESRGHPTDNQSAVAEPLLVAIAVVVGVGFGGGCRVGGRTEQHVGVTLRCGFDSGTQTGAARSWSLGPSFGLV